MDDPRRVTIAGNGVSGFACAARLAEHGVPVTLIGPGLPHDRPPLSKRALLTGRLPLLADAGALAAAGIEHVDGCVTAVDLGRRELAVACRDAALDGAATAAGSDLTAGGGGPLRTGVRHFAGPLVWATGVRHVRPPVPGFERAHLIATAAGFGAATGQLAARPGQHVVVVGAGLVGSEAAATLALQHEVTLADVAERPLARLHDPLPELAGAALAERGVRVLTGCRIERLTADAVATATHGDLAADVVIAATGTAGSVPAGLGGALRVDTDCRVAGLDRVWACGDCAVVAHPRHGDVGFQHWDWARRTGRQAADSIAGRAEPFDAEPYWFSTIGSTHLHEIGLAEAAATWEERDGLHVGLRAGGSIAAVLVAGAPARLGEARALLRAAAAPA